MSISLKDVYEVTHRIEDKLDRMEIRVSLLEQWRAQIVGQLILVSSAFAIGISVIIDWLKKKINV